MVNKADIIDGKVPSESELGWKKFGQQILEGSIDAIKSTADKIISLDTGLVTIYVAALTFLKIPENIVSYLPWYLSYPTLAIPIIIWLYSIHESIQAYSADKMPFHKDRPDSIKQAYDENRQDKYKHLTRGKYSFIAGLIVTSVILVVGSALQPQPPMRVQFNVANDSAPVLENMSITVNNQTMNTMPLTLIAESDTFYKVQLDNKKIIIFNKDMVNGMMYSTNTS